MPTKIRPDRVGEHRTAFEKNRRIVMAASDTCGICGNKVEKNIYKYPHPLSAVVDHIVPVAKGGHPSDISNLQLAHRWCNRQKSDKLAPVADALKKKNENIANDNLPLHADWKAYRAK